MMPDVLRAVAVVCVAVLPSMAAGQTKASEPIRTTVSQLAGSPETFAGKIVSVRSQVIFGRGPFILTEGDHRVELVQPGNSGVEPKPRFKFVEDANWKKLQDLLYPSPNMKPQQVFATVEGRFDTVCALRKGKRVRVKDGFGHMGLYDYRIVLRSIEPVEVVAVEQDGGR
jgi:hypothetical protein